MSGVRCRMPRRGVTSIGHGCWLWGSRFQASGVSQLTFKVRGARTGTRHPLPDTHNRDPASVLVGNHYGQLTEGCGLRNAVGLRLVTMHGSIEYVALLRNKACFTDQITQHLLVRSVVRAGG